VSWILGQTVLLGALLLAALLDVGPTIGGGRTAPTTAIGTGLLVASLLLALVAFRDLGAALRVRPAPRAGARLVDRGVYRILRHPMYTSVALVGAGLAFREATWSVALAAAAVVVFYLAKARHEESLLLATYPEYAEYRRRTFGVLPFRRG
jgi:protein-S-isoprenylcysteine O-methyltransferase Ste14